jgi:glutaminyl-peptide cyclotransferase
MPRWFHRTLALLLFASAAPAWAAIPVYGYKVVHAWPHDTAAYTEGLFYKDGHLYESTGQVGESTVRKVELETGEVLQRHRLPRQYFGEGIVDWKDRMVQLTWQSQTGFVYDLASLAPQKAFSYPGEGWALTRDDHQLYMSDGTAELRVLDPETLAEVRRIQVTADGVPVTHLNELEWVDGEIYANVWLTERIARIDPKSGHVVGWIDLTGLFDNSQLPNPVDDVLNGIAWDASNKRLFVTGKCWPQLFEIQLVHRAGQ